MPARLVRESFQANLVPQDLVFRVLVDQDASVTEREAGNHSVGERKRIRSLDLRRGE